MKRLVWIVVAAALPLCACVPPVIYSTGPGTAYVVAKARYVYKCTGTSSGQVACHPVTEKEASR